ncbi:hypothetical protein HSACCH_01376 [Halanaerobium saccharolyticum subsp. saccharolyticum DSM 6643]|uniref:Uncharacterized protein n=1 Tax=Halanaerobium saccharolyticum subsp. saccharolyticum DSM 6643 TaxID=1293054 RepID=M5E061_9FIRM|nr:hypothetical protein HSACCH_01376 [Halanaerobium saccharolyticum subsp. saccharolyticum DSM 6643]
MARKKQRISKLEISVYLNNLIFTHLFAIIVSTFWTYMMR